MNALEQAWQQVKQLPQNIGNFFNQGPNQPFVSPIPKRDILTQSLPAGFNSPVPQNAVVPHPIGPSAFQSAIEGYKQQVAYNKANPFFNNTGNNPLQWAGKVVQDIGKRGPFEGLQDLTYPILMNPYIEPITEPITSAVRVANYQAGRPNWLINNLLGQTDGQMARPTIQQPTPTPTPTPIPRVAPAPKTLVHPDFASFVNEQLLPLTRKYGIPDAVAAAQAAQESGYKVSPGAGQYNYWGLKSNSPDLTRRGKFANFDSLEAAVKYYAETLQSKVPNGDLSQYNNNPMGLLQMIQSNPSNRYEGHNPNPMQYVYDTTNNPYWQAYGGGQSMAQNPNGWLGAKPSQQ